MKYAPTFLGKSAAHALKWVSGLVHTFPTDVLALIQRIAEVLETPGTETQLFISAAGSLLDISVTLQRIPNFRESGLAVFERLLTLGIYGARHALDEVDVWARYRRPL